MWRSRDIRAEFAGKYDFQTGSDCEVILALYREWKAAGSEDPSGIFEKASGIFAFALYDEETDEYLIGRDPIGVIPLYIGHDKEGRLYVASELKALEGFCDEYEPFLPGHYYWSRDGKMVRWYRREWMERMPGAIPSSSKRPSPFTGLARSSIFCCIAFIFSSLSGRNSTSSNSILIFPLIMP